MQNKPYTAVHLLCLALLLSGISQAQTIVTANITVNTTWTLAGSPYVLQNNITVTAGDTLTIEPGVVVKFNATTRQLTVQGRIVANGTPADTIVFTSYKDDAHGGDTNGNGQLTPPPPATGIHPGRFRERGSSFQYCKILYGGNSTGGALNVFSGTASVTNCEFGFSLDKTGLAKALHANPTISNLTFSGGDFPAIALLEGDVTSGSFTLQKHPDFPYLVIASLTLGTAFPPRHRAGYDFQIQQQYHRFPDAISG
ncbi:MAG: hypothetical protein IPM98_06305 [Lewinellaceae bacterium]|nr:hypothetical protein [Lewinellaceae bacterium]